jgi:hypothetical protein
MLQLKDARPALTIMIMRGRFSTEPNDRFAFYCFRLAPVVITCAKREKSEIVYLLCDYMKSTRITTEFNGDISLLSLLGCLLCFSRFGSARVHSKSKAHEDDRSTCNNNKFHSLRVPFLPPRVCINASRFMLNLSPIVGFLKEAWMDGSSGSAVRDPNACVSYEFRCVLTLIVWIRR